MARSLSGYDTERLALEYAEIESKEKNVLRANIIRALERIAGNRQEALTKLSGEIAETKRSFADATARYYGSTGAGKEAAFMRAVVDMAELAVTAPLDFAKAAYAPDTAILDYVQKEANPNNDASTTDATTQIPQKAWKAFYSKVVPEAGNLRGTYDAMESRYGKDTYSLATDRDLGGRRAAVLDKIERENKGADVWEKSYASFAGVKGAYDTFVKEQGADPNDPETLKAFYNSTGMTARLPLLKDPAFIGQLAAAVQAPRSLEQELFLEVGRSGVAGLDEEAKFMRGLLPKDDAPTTADTADTERDLLASWIKRPDVQWWAKQNNLNLGTTKELTEQMKADIAAGKFPGAVYTKYGVYIPGPDDLKARQFAKGQLNRDPSKNLFRALGIGRGGGGSGPQTIVEVTVGKDPALYKDPDSEKFYRNPETGKYIPLAELEKHTRPVYAYENGHVAQRADGVYVWSTDEGETWSPIAKSAGEKMVAGAKVAGRDDILAAEARGKKMVAEARSLKEKRAAEKLAAEGIAAAEMVALASRTPITAVVGMEATDEPPPEDTYRGVRKRATYRDVEGSVRFVNEETGDEEYITPDIIRGVSEPGLRADASRPSLARTLRRAVTKGAAERQGFEGPEQEHQDVPGEKPDTQRAFLQEYPGSGKGREKRARPPIVPAYGTDEMLRPVPSSDTFVQEYSRTARMSDAEATTRDAPDRRSQPGITPPALLKAAEGYTAPEMILARKPGPSSPTAVPGGPVSTRMEPGALGDTRVFTAASPEGEAPKAGTTTPSSTTPTQSTTPTAKDPRRKLFAKRRPPVAAAPPKAPPVEPVGEEVDF